ncbi:MATE family efflux transporter [Hathewaya histolytica]|uniref:MATE family efflux transporter n=1 Tax=Hathewaya histolytica TaxID=1498 RepID=UPI003B66D8B7
MTEINRLGKENVKRLLFSLAIPAIIGQLVSLLYNMVDRMYIGHIPEVGGNALTGVGVTAPLLIIISAFSVLIGMGGAPRASIKMGEKDDKAAEEIMGNCFITLIVISVILTAFFLIFNEKLLILFGASENTLPYALEYMKIYTLGTIFVQLAIGMNPFISSQGFAKISMITVSIGAVINIVLDPIFIYGFKMNVKGAALATVISQAISAIWVIHFLRGEKTNLKLRKENFKINKSIMGPVLLLGLSPFVMQVTESFIIIAFTANLQKYGGDVAVGAMTILSGGAFVLGVQIACQQTFIALGNAKTSLFLALLRKVFLLIPLVLILPKFMSNKVFAVFLAEPISDIIAATVTGILFYREFSSTLSKINFN